MPEKEISWPTIITAIVALYGAGLATYSAVSSNIRNKRRIKVSLSIGIVASGVGASRTVILINASNPGDKPVTANSITLELPGNKHAILPHYPGSTALPHELMPGKALSVYMDTQHLSTEIKGSGYKGTITLRARCYEATGELFKSNKFKYDIEGWLKP